MAAAQQPVTGGAGEPVYRVKRSYSVIAHGPDCVEVRRGIWNPTSITVNDESGAGKLAAVVGMLTEFRQLREMADAVGTDQTDVAAIVELLQEKDLVETAPGNYLDYYLDVVQGQPLSEAVALDHEQAHRVHLIGGTGPGTTVAGVLEQVLTAALPAVEIRHEAQPHPVLDAVDTSWLHDGLEFERTAAGFEHWLGGTVVLAEQVINPVRAQLVNRICLRLGVPFLYAAVDGPVLMVGPLVVPGRTACWECFETRVLMNMRGHATYQRYKEALVAGQVAEAPSAVLPAAAHLVASHAAFELMSFLTTRSSVSCGQVLSVYLPTLEISINEVLRLPGCAGCAPLPERDAHELYFDMRTLATESAS